MNSLSDIVSNVIDNINGKKEDYDVDWKKI